MNSKGTYKLLLLLACSLCFSICHAQNYSFQGVLTPTVTVQTVMNIEVISNASNTVNFSSTANYSNGISIADFATVKIKSNALWAFGASTTTPFFSASGAFSSPNMPSHVLAMSLSTLTQNQPLTTTSKTLTTGGRGNISTPGNTFNLNLYASPGYDYGPGIYSITINYTLTAQ